MLIYVNKYVTLTYLCSFVILQVKRPRSQDLIFSALTMQINQTYQLTLSIEIKSWLTSFYSEFFSFCTVVLYRNNLEIS